MNYDLRFMIFFARSWTCGVSVVMKNGPVKLNQDAELIF